MQNKFLYLLLSVVLLTECSNENKSKGRVDDGSARSIIISGEVQNPQGEYIVLEKVQDNEFQFVDSIRVEDDNTFSTKVEISEPQYFRIDFFGIQKRMLILNKDDLKLTVAGDAAEGLFQVEGSLEMDQVAKVDTFMTAFQEEAYAYNKDYMQAQKDGNMKEMQAIREEVMALQQRNIEKLKKEISQMEPTLAVLNFLASFINPDEDYQYAQEVASKIEAKYPESSHVQQYMEELNNMKSLAVGQKAPDIALPNPEGDTIRLSSLEGKVVLIDFWASWCKPCRVENPNVVKVYEQYKDEGFEIYGVSLDRSKDAWVKAIEQDGLEWPHVSDLAYFNSEAARLYNVTAIPHTVLIDREGNILAKNLRGKALEDKLREIFG